jgi:hypothetical protein
VPVIGYGHAMSERDTDFSASTDNSAIMDSSRSTAEFRAFAASNEAEQPWSMRAPGRKVAMLAGIVVAVAVVLAIIAIAVLNG